MYEINQTVKLIATAENTARRNNLIPAEMTGVIVAVDEDKIEVELSDESWAQCDEKAKSLKLVKRYVKVFPDTALLRSDFDVEIVTETVTVSETSAEAPVPMTRQEWNAVQNLLGPSLPAASYEEYLENLRKVQADAQLEYAAKCTLYDSLSNRQVRALDALASGVSWQDAAYGGALEWAERAGYIQVTRAPASARATITDAGRDFLRFMDSI